MPNKKQVEEILNNLITEYNDKLEECKTKALSDTNSKIELGLNKNTSKDLYLTFINDLTALLNKIENFKTQKLGEDFISIKKCLDIIETGKSANENDDNDLVKTIDQINNIIIPTLPFDKQKKYKIMLKQVFVEESANCKEIFSKYFNTNNTIQLEEPIEISIRKKLVRVLEDLNNDVSKNYIIENTKKILKDVFASRSDSLENIYFNNIYSSVNRIKELSEKLNKTDSLKTLENILKNQFETEEIKNYLREIEIDLDKLSLKEQHLYRIIYTFIKVYNIQLDLEQLDNELNNISNYKVKRQ